MERRQRQCLKMMFSNARLSVTWDTDNDEARINLIVFLIGERHKIMVVGKQRASNIKMHHHLYL